MTEKVKVALVGIGNNTSALVQGVAFYRATGSGVGIRRPDIAGLGIADVEFASAFAISDDKIGQDLHDAIFLPPNNYPRLIERLPPSGVTVQRGLTGPAEIGRAANVLADAEVLLYSAPSGHPDTARAFAEAAPAARVAFLTENGATKMRSKLNAVAADQVAVAPFGYLPHLKSQKVAHLDIEA